MEFETKPRKNVAVLFGGRSAEHEISIITGIDLIAALDTLQFHPIPVYIDSQGVWYTGSALLDREFYRGMPENLAPDKGLVEKVILLPIPGYQSLLRMKDQQVVLDPAKQIPVDVFFPSFHGQFGEDGCIQGLFEMADVAYTGCGVLASAVAMNKYACKMLLQAHDIPVLPAATADKTEAQKDFTGVCKAVLNTPGLQNFPLFVKPCNLGSSIGIGVAKDEAELAGALAKVFKYDLTALVEPCLNDMFEINMSVLGAGETRASVVEIPVASSGVLTYEDKYLRGGGKKSGSSSSLGMASLVRSIDPPDLPEHYKQAVAQYALTAFQVLQCSGVVRFDFMVDKATGKLYFNELNPLPGSQAYYLWAKSKPRLLYTEMLTKIIEAALAAYQQKNSLQRETGFKALLGR